MSLGRLSGEIRPRDGLGPRISPGCAEMIAAKLAVVETPKSVAAFQVQFWVCKGMLKAEVRPWAGRNLIGIRPSMVKFRSGAHRTIEVISWACIPKPAFLSRQLIQLLEARGIPARGPESLQAEHLHILADVMLTGRATAHLRALVDARSLAAALLAPRPGTSPDALRRVCARLRERHVSDLRDSGRIYVHVARTYWASSTS